MPLKGHSNVVLSVCYSPDGNRIATGSRDNLAMIWDGITGAFIGVILKGHSDFISSVKFSPDGTRIVTGSHDTLARIWDSKSGG